jgi:predicted RNase H-like HicB family nuclease
MGTKFNIHIILYSEDDIQVAHCLEFDIVAQGRSKIEALRNLIDAIDIQISFALDNYDLASIFTPAPTEYWKMVA